LLDGTTGHYRPKRDGARKRKSVRGCIVGNDLSCLNLMIVKRGPHDIPKLTDKGSDRPSTRGPKRANHIRAVWGLSKGEDVRKYVVRRKIPGKDGKPDRFKSPKIQRLITPVVRQRKKRMLKAKRQRYEKAASEAAEYQKILAQRRQHARASILSKKREAKSERKSVKVDTTGKPTTTGKPAAKTVAAKTTPAKTEPTKKAEATTSKAKTATKPATTTKTTGAKTTGQAGKQTTKATGKGKGSQTQPKS